MTSGISVGGGLYFAGFETTPEIPANTVAPSIGGSPYVGNTVYAINGTWTGSPSPTFTYDWLIDAVSTGITTSTYEVQAGDDTKTLSCEVTATNASGSAMEPSNDVLCGTQPVNTVAPAVTGTTEEGETLTTDDGTWTGTATIIYTYQWERDGASISGEVASTYTLVLADIGSMIDCVVNATNGYNSVDATSNSVGPITPAGLANNLQWGTGSNLEWGTGSALAWG